jgi:hypothetical protein
MLNRVHKGLRENTIGCLGNVFGKSAENTALLFSPIQLNMAAGKKESGSLGKSDTTKTDITFTKEKKALWSFLFKCWKKCFGKKSKPNEV